MSFLETLKERNEAFAKDQFSPDLKIMPTMKTVIIGCVDPRVDPVDIFQLKPGETVVVRNVGGRIDMATLQTMAIVRSVATANGKEVGPGWNLIVLHHTDCGIVPCHHHAPALLEKYFNVTKEGLDAMEIDDPYKAVAVDVAKLKANPNLPGEFIVSGLVYDVATGRIDTVVPPSLLREASV
ncbi:MULTISPECIES: carbonic anhydrase [Burkholderiaceae]|uniref:Carbonic anhydrase n=1 Tax=Caballeronia sordidicola TaxID=196367 RepID=A0A242MUT3_CABSO|nr:MULTISPECIES: carbonic anhydrase [Burkholderiaceae]AME27086.1 carbonic anhydrase [Burkholderia sp. PAMC 26561]AME27769.1 carbonic anhydrase [Burkholderia sp. PAMC 26561]OTP75083.1 Carbonic anhydrase [Caballeronia sordidicola]